MTTITEYLAEQKRLAEAATEGPWVKSFFGGSSAPDDPPTSVGVEFPIGLGGADCGTSIADADFIAAARASVPRMIAALEAVAGAHQRDFVLTGYCVECSDFGTDQYPPGRMIEWPCPTIRAIEAALGGEGSGE